MQIHVDMHRFLPSALPQCSSEKKGYPLWWGMGRPVALGCLQGEWGPQ